VDVTEEDEKTVLQVTGEAAPAIEPEEAEADAPDDAAGAEE
jgi:hypothetical protein